MDALQSGTVPPQNIQPDGLNPHRSGSYLVVYEQKLGDFVLEFDYKLSKGCNSGVFLRVSDLNNPVQTGIEVALDDTRRGDDRDSGGFHGLVAPHVYAQKPAGQWNHMTITAQGPRLAVSLNDTEVSSINLDLWTKQGKRPDGRSRFKDRAVARMARTGYLGFQDLGGDCWFKNIVLKRITGGFGEKDQRSRGYHASGTVIVRPSSRPTFNSSSVSSTSTAFCLGSSVPHISHRDKVGIHGQPRRLAFLRMELAGRQVIAPDDRRERFGIVGHGGHIVGISATAW